MGTVEGSLLQLLAPKFLPPLPRRGYVRRQRLHDRMVRAATTPLTLLSAPAGCGKTALVGAWLADLPDEDWAWLSLDALDDDPVRFWTYVVEALRNLVPGVGEATLSELIRSAGQSPVDHWLDSLLNELVIDRPPAYLVLDDLHVIEDPRIRASVTLFVANMPSWLRLIVLTRADPPLPLPRLRAEGRLTEIRQADLRFDTAEVDRLLRAQGVDDLADDQVDWVTDRTEGWAAGVQLAAVVLADDPTPDRLQRISGTNRTFGDYLVSEVVDPASDDLRQFLFTTSVLERTNPSLARAVSGLVDAGDVLRSAHERGLFIVALDDDGEWFRYHALFAEAVQAEARATAPELVVLANERAARWFEAQDDVVQAVEHWFAAHRLDEALRIALAAAYRLMDVGQTKGVERMAGLIPGSLVGEDADQQLDYAMLHFPSDAELFLAWVDQAEATIAATDRPDEAVERRYHAVRTICDLAFGRWEDAARHGEASIERSGTDAGDTALVQRAGLQLMRARAWLEEPEAVEAMFRTVLNNPRLDALARTFIAPCTWALAAAVGGRMGEAETWCHRATAVASEVGVPQSAYQELLFARALIHRERGEDDAAREAIGELREVSMASYHSLRVLAEVELVLSAIGDEHTDEAGDLLERVPQMLPSSPMGPRIHDAVDRAWTEVHLAKGDVSSARASAQRLRGGFWRHATLARVHVAVDELDAAADVLTAARPSSPRQQVTCLLLEAIARSDRDPAASTTALETALTVAAAEGMFQTVVTLGRDHGPLLEPASWAVPDDWMRDFRNTVAKGVRGGTTGRVADLHEQPTERERHVARFLASRLTVPEIARELGVSPNTLKTHLKALYRKLGVSSREEAVAEARRLGILS